MTAAGAPHGAIVIVGGGGEIPRLPALDEVRTALEAFAARYGLRVDWGGAEPPPRHAYDRIAIQPRDIDAAGAAGMLRLYPIGPDPDRDVDGDEAAALVDALVDDLNDRGYFVRGAFAAYGPLYVAVRPDGA